MFARTSWPVMSDGQEHRLRIAPHEVRHNAKARPHLGFVDRADGDTYRGAAHRGRGDERGSGRYGAPLQAGMGDELVLAPRPRQRQPEVQPLRICGIADAVEDLGRYRLTPP